MERIRSAIDKARAERDRREYKLREEERVPATPEAEAAAPALEAAAPPPPASPSDSEAAWMALEDFHPRPALMRRNRILSFEGGPDAVSFNVMRTRLLQSITTNGWRRVAVTSPGAGCGKTTTCLNLAFSLARLPDVRTLLIEADMRRPTMAKTLGLRKPQLIARVLEGVEAPGDHLVRYGTNLAIGTNHRAVPNTAEILMSARIGEVLKALEARYEPTLTIFDLPPLLASDDTLAFLGQVDCALLVGAAESTTIKEIDVCEQDIARQTNVLGVVLNKCRYLDESHGYGYYDYG